MQRNAPRRTHRPGAHSSFIAKTLRWSARSAEEGKLGFTRSLNGADAHQLQRDLPQLALSAQLQGIDTSSPALFVDESLFEMREAVEGLFVSRADLIGVEMPPATTKINLLPDSWRQRRQELAEAGAMEEEAALGRRRLRRGAAPLFRLCDGAAAGDRPAQSPPRTRRARRRNSSARPRRAGRRSRPRSIRGITRSKCCCTSSRVCRARMCKSRRSISRRVRSPCQGEAKNAALAYQVADKVKKHPDLQMYQFDMAAPRILPNERAQFRLEGKPK